MTPVLRVAGWLLAVGLVFSPAHALVVTDSVKVNEVSYDPTANPETPAEYIELYNAGSATAYLDGAVLTDEGNLLTIEATFQFPGNPGDSTIALPAHGFMLLVGDATGSPYAASATFEFYGGGGDTDDPAVPNLVCTAGLATNLYLGNGGDGITLSIGISNGSVIPCNEVVDGVSWEGGDSEVTAVSNSVCADPASHAGYTNGGPTGLITLQRCPDGADTQASASDFLLLDETPGTANRCNSIPPEVTGLTFQPCFVTEQVPVTVVCNASDVNADLESVQLFYKPSTAAGFDSIAMNWAAPNVYSALLPAQADQSLVQYYVAARDSLGNMARSPSTAPELPARYLVGLQSIAALQEPAVIDSCAASSLAGAACSVMGVVTHVAYEYSDSYFYIQQGSGASSGLRVYTPPGASFVPEYGDSVQISGVLGEYYCQTEVALTAGCGIVLASNCEVQARPLAGVADLNQEENESMLVWLPGPIDVTAAFDSTNLGREFQVAVLADTAYVGDDTFLPDGIGYTPVPQTGGQLSSLTGIVAYRRVDTTAPGPRQHQELILRLEPRRDSDVSVIGTDTGDPCLEAVRAFSLRQNSPNPFNPVTTVEFGVASPGAVRLRIYDARGQVVRLLLDRVYAAAARERVTWDGRDDAGRAVPSGVYFYELRAGDDIATRKMLLLK